MARPPALLDEDVRLGLISTLKDRGFDVVSVQTVGPRGVDDTKVLERATELGRFLMTHNTVDFKTVHGSFVRLERAHRGIICLPQRGSLERRTLRTAMMLDWLASQPHESRLFVWGQLQQLLERSFQIPGYSEEEVRVAIGRS